MRFLKCDFRALIFLAVCSTIHAKQALFDLVPITPSSITIPANSSGNVSYLVTNNTKLTRSLIMIPVSGITQLTTSFNSVTPLCGKMFTLAPKEHCVLSLQINSNQITKPIISGPTVCQVKNNSSSPNPFLCARPTSSASLNVDTTTNPVIQTETIVFMRHGEKSMSPQGEIDCQGENRSFALPQVLNTMFGRPNYIFAPNPASQIRKENPENIDATYNYLRPLGTIEPTAVSLGMPINTTYAFNDDSNVATVLLSHAYHNALLFVAWEHNNFLKIIRDIVRLTHSDVTVPSWPGANDYDPLYVLTIKTLPNKQQQVYLEVGHEGLNGQSTQCTTSSKNSINPQPIPAPTGSKTLLFIPEAEAAKQGMGQLSCKGWNRSVALASELQASYGNFTALYAPGSNFTSSAGPSGKISEGNGTYDYLRAIMTIQPTVVQMATSLGQPSFIPPQSPETINPLNPLYAYSQIQTVAQALLSIPMPSVSTPSTSYAIAWQKTDMLGLISLVYQGLGGNAHDIPSSIPDPDTMYQITITSEGKLSFTKVKEHLNTVSAQCFF